MLASLADLGQNSHVVHERLHSFLELHGVRCEDLRRFRLLETSYDFPVLGRTLRLSFFRRGIVCGQLRFDYEGCLEDHGGVLLQRLFRHIFVRLVLRAIRGLRWHRIVTF